MKTSFEPVLVPWLESLTIAQVDGLIALEKLPRLVVHGGNEHLGDDLVSRLKAGFAQAGRGAYLGVHHRLDKDASGVMVFTRCRDRNAEVAAAFERHDVERVYVAAVQGELPERSGEMVHRLLPVKGRATQVVRAGGKRAVARYRVLHRQGNRMLVELRPETGRTHQLRVQLAASGAPIAGDALYGGPPAARLMLHAVAIGLLGERFESRLPPAFSRWLEGDASLGSPSEVARALLEAAWLRQPLARDHDSYRLVNADPDGLPGVVVDRYGDFVTLAVATDEAHRRRVELAQALLGIGARGVYLKVRVQGDVRRLSRDDVAPGTPLAGVAAPDPLLVSEGAFRLAVRLGDGLSTGLFVDQRENRRLVGELASSRTLNLFAYTGSFSVAAALGGSVTTSVDASARALDRVRENLALNGIDPTQHVFVKADIVEWLRRARQRPERFDLVILDPPTFGSRGKKRAFSMEKTYGHVARDAIDLLAPSGRLLAVTNHRKTSVARLRRLLHQAARDANRGVQQLKGLPSPLDCPPSFDGPTPSKSVLLTVT